jgi:hypothetical protein
MIVQQASVFCKKINFFGTVTMLFSYIFLIFFSGLNLIHVFSFFFLQSGLKFYINCKHYTYTVKYYNINNFLIFSDFFRSNLIHFLKHICTPFLNHKISKEWSELERFASVVRKLLLSERVRWWAGKSIVHCKKNTDQLRNLRDTYVYECVYLSERTHTHIHIHREREREREGRGKV